MGTSLRWLVFGLLPCFSASADARRMDRQRREAKEGENWYVYSGQAEAGWDRCSVVAEGGETRYSSWRRASEAECKCHRGWVISASLDPACKPYVDSRYFPTSLPPGVCKCGPASICAQQESAGKKAVFMYGSTGLEKLAAQVKNPNLAAFKAVLPGYSRIFAGSNTSWSGGVSTLWERHLHHHATNGYVVFLTEAEALLADTYKVDTRSRDCREQCSGDEVQACREACAGSVNPWEASAKNQYRRKSVTAEVYRDGSKQPERCDSMAYVMNGGSLQNKEHGLRWQDYPSHEYLAALSRSMGRFWKGLDDGDRPAEHEEFAGLTVYGLEDANSGKLRKYMRWYPPSEIADELGLRSTKPDLDAAEDGEAEAVPDNTDVVPTWRIKEGFLEKQSRYMKEWRKRWVVLTPQYLSTYESELDHQQATEVIKLSDISTVKPGAADAERQYTLTVVTPERTYYLAAESWEEQESWVNSIGQQIVLQSGGRS